MYYLGLDPSLTSYGWCVYDIDAPGFDKVVERGRWKTDAKMAEPARYMHQRDHLRAVVKKYNITRAAMETPPQGQTGAWSQEKLYALYIYNLEVMYTEGVDILLLAPSQLTLLARVWGSGIVKGDWFKSDMVRTARFDMLDLYNYPRHGDFYDLSPTKKDRKRNEGYTSVPFPFVDVSSYEKDIRKKLKIQGDEADAYHAARAAARFWAFLDGQIDEDDLTPSEWDVFAQEYTFTRGKKAGTTEQSGIRFKEGKRYFRFATSPVNNPSHD